MLRDERTTPRLRTLLAEIPGIKRFGEEFSLAPTGNFVEYVALDRPAATWVVTASDPLRFRPRQWRFPLVGSFTYLGWFDRENAVRFGEGLRSEGLDVDVRGARAYSTLGWFRDPVFSSMIADGDEALGELVNVVLHESVHTTVYVSGQSWFNESLASWVADRITPEYLRRRFGPESPATRAWASAVEREAERGAELRTLYRSLETLYDSSEPAERKVARKAELIGGAQRRLKTARAINNASLIQFRTYGQGEAEFAALFRACGESWNRFWKRVRGLDSKRFGIPQREDFGVVVAELAREGC